MAFKKLFVTMSIMLTLMNMCVGFVHAEVEKKVKVSSNDTTSGFLNGKLVAGSNVTLVENNDGSNETLTINSSVTGSGTVLDLGDNGSNESSGLTEIATVGDTNNIFTEPSSDKLLITLSNDWPKADTSDDLTCTNCIGATEIDGASLESEIEAVADLQDFQGAVTDAQVPNTITIDLATTATTANSGDSATAFFSTGQIELARGGTGTDTSGFGNGLFGLNSTIFTDIDTETELETALGGLDVVTVTSNDITSANLITILTDETGTGSAVFSNSPVFTTPNIGSATGSITGNAGTATALAANGTNASAGNAILGVDAQGNAEGAFDVATQTEFDAHTTATAAHGATGAVVGTTNTQTLTNKTITAATNTVEATTGDSATAFFSTGTLEDARLSTNVIVAGDTFSGDVTATLEADGDTPLTIASNSVALTTDTTGNYVANTSTSILTGLTGGSAGSEGASLSLAFDYSQALTGDFGLAANATVFGQAGLITEGATADTFEGFLAFADVTADRTWTLPDRSGTVSLSGDTFTGDVTGTLNSSGATALTIASNSIALTTDTTGNYVQSITNGTGITGGDGGSEGAALTLSVINDSTTQKVEVAKNGAATTSTRKRLNFVEGANITLTITDDSGNNEADITIASTGGSGYSTIEDEDTPLTQRSTLNFEGAGVSCADDTTKTTCTIPGSGAATITVEEDNTTVSTVITDIDFGSGFDVTESPSGEANLLMDLSENVTGDVLFDTSNVSTIQANSVALTTDTTGNYVGTVADGTGIDGTAAGEGATYTPTLDTTEINDTTWGDNTDATITHTFDPTGATNPVWSYTNSTANLSTGTLQYAGVEVVNLSASQTLTNKTIAVASNSVTSTASRCARFDGSGLLTAASGDCTAGDTTSSGYATIQDEGSSLTQRTTLNFTGSGVSCVDNSGSSRTDCTISGGGGGGMTWNEITGTSQTMSVNNGYIANNASLVTLTLPSTCSVGDTIRVTGKGAGGWLVAQNSGDIVHFGNQDTTTGTGGSLASTHRRDGVEVICVVANDEWNVLTSQGNITVT